jgi:hypothetical protein
VLLARTATAAATLAPWSKAIRAEKWFDAKQLATIMRMTIPRRGGSFPDMGRDVIKVLPVALCLFAAGAAADCRYPDEGTMPLHRAITKVKLLPETEAWARQQTAVVQYALFLDRTRERRGRCYWTIEARAEGKVWRRFYVTPDGKSLLSE